MISARLLAATLLLCPLLAFAQEKQPPATSDSSSAAPTSVRQADSSSTQALTGEQKAELSVRALDRLLAGRHIDPNTQHPWITLSPDGKVLAWGIDEDCYTIRSYVVARDEKNSDSTHLVRSSTCQPATRFQMKNADMKSDSDHK
jgi:hypothetical protein